MPKRADGKYSPNSGPLAGSVFKSKSQYETVRAHVAGFSSARQMRKVTQSPEYKAALKDRQSLGTRVTENFRMRVLRKFTGAAKQAGVTVDKTGKITGGGGGGGGGGGSWFGAEWWDDFWGDQDWGDVDDDDWY
jgi:hypothetical protein